MSGARSITESMNSMIVNVNTGELKKNIGLSNHGVKGATLNFDVDASMWIKCVSGTLTWAGDGAGKLVNSGAEEILNISRYYVPIATGALLNSGYVDKSTVTGRDYSTGNALGAVHTATVGYGRDNGDVGASGLPPSTYANRVHEDLKMNHPNGGEAKFLERAFREYVASKWPSQTVFYVETLRKVFQNPRTGKWYRTNSQGNYHDKVMPVQSNKEHLDGIYATNSHRSLNTHDRVTSYLRKGR